MITIVAPKIRTEVTFGQSDIRIELGYQALPDGTRIPALCLVQYDTKEECLEAIKEHATPEPDVILIFPTDQAVDNMVLALMRIKEARMALQGVTGEAVSVTLKEDDKA